MNDEDYSLWVSAHILATGGREEQLKPFLDANRDAFARIGATYAELCECTQRLIERGEIPDWPREHANAVIQELRRYRIERQKTRDRETFPQRYSAVGHVEKCDCPQCHGGEILPSYEAARNRLSQYVKESASGKKKPRKKP